MPAQPHIARHRPTSCSVSIGISAADAPHTGDVKAFSLLELMVVVAMMGVMAAIALPNIVSEVRRADGERATLQVAGGIVAARDAARSRGACVDFVRNAAAVIVAEDVLDALRLQQRSGPDLAIDTHQRFFTQDRQPTLSPTTDGFVVEWQVAQVRTLSFRQVDLTVRWRGLDRREHRLAFVTFRPG